jgi:hypothetical protein
MTKDWLTANFLSQKQFLDNPLGQPLISESYQGRGNRDPVLLHNGVMLTH